MPRSFRALAAAAVAHAVIVLLLWRLVFYAEWALIPDAWWRVLADWEISSGRAWLVVAWLWLLWPPVLALHRTRTLKRVSVPVIIGFAFLAPCVPTMFALTAWAIAGFAP